MFNLIEILEKISKTDFLQKTYRVFLQKSYRLFVQKSYKRLVEKFSYRRISINCTKLSSFFQCKSFSNLSMKFKGTVFWTKFTKPFMLSVTADQRPEVKFCSWCQKIMTPDPLGRLRSENFPIASKILYKSEAEIEVSLPYNWASSSWVVIQPKLIVFNFYFFKNLNKILIRK